MRYSPSLLYTLAFTHERTVIKPLGFASWFTTLLSRVAHIKKKKEERESLGTRLLYVRSGHYIRRSLRRRGAPLRQNGLGRTLFCELPRSDSVPAMVQFYLKKLPRVELLLCKCKVAVS